MFTCEQNYAIKYNNIMIINIYSVKDSKAQTYGNPFYAVNNGTAIRSFEQAASDPSTTISQYPGDFALYQIGCFDDESGEITANLPQFVANAPVKENE